MPCTHLNHTSSIPHISISVTLAPSHFLSINTCNTNDSTRITVTATTASTKYDPMTTDTTQVYRPSSKSERNLIILQVNINGIKNKLEELKLLIHDTYADTITIQETKLTSKANTPKVHNFTTVRPDRLHKAGGGLITLIRDNITFTTTDISSTINTHTTELQMVKVRINNTKHTRSLNGENARL